MAKIPTIFPTFKSVFPVVAAITLPTLVQAQAASDDIEVDLGNSTGTEVIVTQEVEIGGDPLNSIKIQIDGDGHIVGGATRLGQFTWAFDGGTDLGKASGQFGSANTMTTDQTGSANVIGFLQGVAAADAGNFSVNITQIGAYGLTASNAHGANVNHGSLATAEDVAGRMDSWLLLGVPADNNTATLTQTGTVNIISSLQLGSDLTTDFVQTGDRNEIWSAQCTDASVVLVDQINGNDNLAVVKQVGDGTGAAYVAEAAIFQDGSGNTSVITQAAALGVVSAEAMITQTGDLNVASIHQAGQTSRGDTVSITQEGDQNTAMMSVYGISNDCQIVQLGQATWANVHIDGSDNQAVVDQSDSGAYASITLEGTGNTVKVTQISNSTPVLLNLSGDGNTLRIRQR